MLWDPILGNIEKTLIGHEGSVNCLCYDPNKNHLFSGSNDKTIK